MDNQILKSIFDRKSVRVYEDREVPKDVKSKIMKAAVQAPTAGNACLYHMIDVIDQNTKDKLAIFCDNQSFIAKAPFVLVFLADWQKWMDGFTTVCTENPRAPGVGDFLLATSDAVIAAQNAVVAAESYGVGSCYIGDVIENCEEMQKLLEIPQYAIPVVLLCFGYPTMQQKKRKKPKRFNYEDLVSENTYYRKTQDELKAMFNSRENDSFEDSVKNLYNRKWSKDFMVEMNNSMEKWIDIFSGK